MTDLHPAAIVRQAADTRLAEQRATAAWRNLQHAERRSLDCNRDLGLELVTIRAARKGKDFLATLERIGVPRSTSYVAMDIARNWKLISSAGSVTAALKAIKENLLAESLTPAEIEAETELPALADPPPFGASAPLAPPAGATGPPPPGSGDAAEAPLPEGVLLDADGHPLPESAKAAIDGAKAIDEWVQKARVLCKELVALQQQPGGLFLPTKQAIQRIRAGWRMVACHKADPVYRCDQCHGASANCLKCKGSGWLPKPMLGEN